MLQVCKYAAKLRLLEHGLLQAAQDLDDLQIRSRRARNGDDDDEPEDDFNAAWEALEVARKLYDERSANDDEIKLKLADTYVLLGDVSMETGMLHVCAQYATEKWQKNSSSLLRTLKPGTI